MEKTDGVLFAFIGSCCSCLGCLKGARRRPRSPPHNSTRNFNVMLLSNSGLPIHSDIVSSCATALLSPGGVLHGNRQRAPGLGPLTHYIACYEPFHALKGGKTGEALNETVTSESES